MSDQAKHLLAEAKAQARRENIKNFIAKNAKELKIAAIVISVVFIGYIIFSAFQAAQIAKYSAQLQEAVMQQEMRNYEKADVALKNIFESATAPNQIKSFAGLRYATSLLDQDKKSEAAAVYEEIAKCFSCDEYLRNLSALLAAKTWMSDDAEVNSGKLVEKIRKLENSATVLRNQIAEQRGILQLQKNNLEEAYKVFELIVKSQEAAPTVKSRAQDYLNVIVSKGYKNEAKVK